MRLLFHDSFKGEMSIMTTQEVDYAGNEYKQKIDRCVLGNEFEDNCDDY